MEEGGREGGRVGEGKREGGRPTASKFQLMS